MEWPLKIVLFCHWSLPRISKRIYDDDEDGLRSRLSSNSSVNIDRVVAFIYFSVHANFCFPDYNIDLSVNWLFSLTNRVVKLWIYFDLFLLFDILSHHYTMYQCSKLITKIMTPFCNLSYILKCRKLIRWLPTGLEQGMLY